MKYLKLLNLIIFFFSLTCKAQIRGNQLIETRSFEIDQIEFIKINLYAVITIDASAEEGIMITADGNLFEHINTSADNGLLVLDQKEWISSSQKIKITIGAPKLKRLESNTHGVTKLINFYNEQLRVNAPVGNITIEGQTKELRIGSEASTIDASQILATEAYVNIWGYGSVKVNVTENLWADVSNSGRLVYLKRPTKLKIKTTKGGKVLSNSEVSELKISKTKFIKFKIKNNSINRNHFEVVGPKPDGTKFGYGFPMMPYTVRHEDWSIGTKIYKINSLGFRKLLKTIKKEDEGTVVALFE